MPRRASAAGTSASVDRLRDQRVDLPGFEQAHRARRGSSRTSCRVHHVVEAPVHADDRVVLDQHVVRARLGEPAAGEADDEDAAFERDALRRTVVGVAADGVVDDVGAAPAGELLHRVDEVVLAVVDREVGAELLADLDLLRSARGRDHARARGAARAGSPRCRRRPRPRARATSRPAAMCARRCSAR